MPADLFPETEAEVIVFDTEYTAWKGSMEKGWSEPGQKREIVQIGAVALNAADLSELRAFSVFVKPVKNPKLSEYFTRLTGITQEKLDKEGTAYAEAMTALVQWSGALPFYSWGRDDEVLRENAEFINIDFPFAKQRFRDVRAIFGAHGIVTDEYMSSTIPRAFGETPDSRGHDALNDARSIAQALRALKRKIKQQN